MMKSSKVVRPAQAGSRKENAGFVSVKITHNIRTGHELPTVLPNNK